MPRPRILDLRLMSKIARKAGKRDVNSINIIISKKAAKLGISAEAALILLAKEYGIGTSTYQRKLGAIKQAEVRDALSGIFINSRSNDGRARTISDTKQIRSKRASLELVIEYIIQDQELRSRCGDILKASSNFDRPINQATLVLEDRIRKKAQPMQNLVGENLVGYAFNEDLLRTVLQVASNDSDDQRGFTQIIRGIVPAFRNKTHHHIINNFSREEAMKVCGFIDVLLRVVDNSVKIR